MKPTMLAVLIAVIWMQNTPVYKLETRYSVPGNGGFDYVTIDSPTRRLYLSALRPIGHCGDGLYCGTLLYVSKRCWC